MEQIFPFIFLTGLAIFVLGAILLLVAAFRTRIWWGIGIILCFPLALVFFAKHSARSLVPSLLMFFGVLMTVGPSIYTKLSPVDLGPHANVVNGELHLTLTGWDQKDYAILRGRKSAVVLQMANPDVTDLTLFDIKEMEKLRELDLNNTQVTDAGLRTIREQFPKLETLKLSATSITDAGFTESLVPMESLKKLDLRKTKVTGDVVKAWKEAKPGRMVLK